MTNTIEARIETSTICNYNCIFCPHNEMTRKKEIMSMELFEHILYILPKQITTLTLSGMGEALMDKGIFDKIKYAKERGYIVNLLTNGSKLTSINIEKLIHSGLDSIRISIHSVDLNKYQKITGATDKEAFYAISSPQLIAILAKTPIKTIVTVDVIDENKKDIKEIIKKYEHLIDLLEVWKVHNWSSWKNWRKGTRIKKTCGRPFNGPLQIQVDGTVNMCCFDYDGKLLLGDLKTQNLNEVFDSEMYKSIVNFHNGGEDKNLLCSRCDQLYERDESVLIYNSKFGKDRVGKLSTTYREIE